MADDLRRITVQVSEDLYREMREVIHWGHKRHAIEAVLRLIIDAVRKDGQMVLGAIEDGQFTLVPTVGKDDGKH